MKIALMQYDIKWEDKEQNKIIIRDYIKKAKEENADLVCLPEMSLTGFSMNTEGIAEEEKNADTIRFFQKEASENQIHIAFGMVTKSGKTADGHMDTTIGVYNKYYIVDKSGNLSLDYEKIHPFSFGEESNYYSSGNRIDFCNIDGVTVSALICYDLRFPEIFQIASSKAELILVPVNWAIDRIEHYKVLLRARAIENQCYIAGINRVGSGNGLDYSGDSVVFDPYGNKISQDNLLDSNKEGLILAEIDSNCVNEYRKNFTVKKDRKELLYQQLWSGLGKN